MATKDIKDNQGLQRWLGGRLIEETRAITARAAMRSASELKAARRLPEADWAPRLVLVTFRCYAAAWSAARYSQRDFQDSAAAAFAAYVYGGAGTYAADRASFAVAADKASYAVAGDAADAVCYAGTYYSHYEARIASGALWASVRADAKALDQGMRPQVLAYAPLWPDGAPDQITKNWNAIKTDLRDRSIEHWDVWIDWYEARLRGEPGNEEEEVARILEVTDEEWQAGPAVANKKIKDIVARFRSAPSPIPHVASSAATKRHAFISHATQADGARASAIANDLEAAGIPCWVAPRDIPSGADWNDAIMSAIDSCDAMILLVSDVALKSPFVKAEVQHAFEKGKRVLPVRLADSIEAGQIDLRLKIVQHIDGRGEVRTVVASILKSLG